MYWTNENQRHYSGNDYCAEEQQLYRHRHDWYLKRQLQGKMQALPLRMCQPLGRACATLAAAAALN